MTLVPGEPVVVDVRLPALAKPVLLRGRVVFVDASRGGIWIGFHEEDRPTRDFLLEIARGEREVRALPRRSYRFPIEVQVDWQVGGSDELFIASTDDVSWNGVFVRTLSPPPVGTDVSVVLTGPRGETLKLPGRVARTASGGSTGMAVRFAGETQERRHLRRLLRDMDLRGELSFPN
ncbi:MAG TPA: PilZ domain-containing protein [Polyangia bacterium]|nr:PilZ domain-containing protein [Polyangia bacterium]